MQAEKGAVHKGRAFDARVAAAIVAGRADAAIVVFQIQALAT